VGVTGYRIYRDGVEVGTSASTTYSDTGLNSATRYCYTVTAYDAAGNESGQSAETCVTTEDTIPPSVPGNLTATAVSASQIDLSWSASTDNVGVALYRIYRDGALMDSTSSTTYSDSGLSSATQYCYTVTAVDGAGNESGHSNQACDTTDQIEVNVLFLNLFIDITNQNGDGYSQLAEHLQELGFHVAQTYSAPITNAALAGYDIVVFGGDAERIISTGEADVLRGFAQNGGGLLLLGDQGLEMWSTTLFQDLHLVTRPDGSGSWGIAFNSDLLCDDEDYCTYCATENDPDGGVDYPYIRTTTAHPATSGVDVFVYNWGTSLRVDTGIARILADSSARSWGDTNAVYIDDYDEYWSIWDGEGYEPRGAYPAMAVVEPGQGRVIALGDSGVWFNVWFNFNVVGTRNLATSVFTYLSGQ
jgi:chitodextrinase